MPEVSHSPPPFQYNQSPVLQVPNKPLTPTQAVDATTFRAALAAQIKLEKAHTRAGDELSRHRRALPTFKIPDPTSFTWTSATDNTTKSLLDLFGEKRQLIMYHFMLKDTDKEGCDGCSYLVDNLPTELGHLGWRDTKMVVSAAAGVEKINAFKGRMGREGLEWYSSAHTFDAAEKSGEDITFKPRPGFFSLECFLREGDDVYHTYSTTNRGVEVLMGTYTLLDRTKLGRQEDGEPEEKRGWKLHDLY